MLQLGLDLAEVDANQTVTPPVLIVRRGNGLLALSSGIAFLLQDPGEGTRQGSPDTYASSVGRLTGRFHPPALW
jgi:hypothetical protein